MNGLVVIFQSVFRMRAKTAVKTSEQKIPHLERTNHQMGDCFFVVPAAGIEPATY